LLETFNKVYILNLHGNAKKRESAPDGGKDENVFDIMQGVSINIFIKNRFNTPPVSADFKQAEVFHFDIYGKREEKYDFLNRENLASIPWNELDCLEPYHFFVPSDMNLLQQYEAGTQITEIFNVYNSGIQTKNDPLTIKFSSNEVLDVVRDFRELPQKELENKLRIKDSPGWNIQKAINDIKQNKGEIINIQFRLFDIRKTFYTGQSSGFIGRTRDSVMQSMLKDNIGLVFKRTGRIYGSSFDFFFVSKYPISEGLFVIDPLGREYLAPLYLTLDHKGQQSLDDTGSRQPNLNMQIVDKVAEKLGLKFTPEKMEDALTIAPVDLLDYIYAVLHSPTYREKYKEFLKIDFPRVPYPKDTATFWQLVALGSELRQIHLLESPVVNKFITQYPVGGSNEIEKVRYENGNVYINDTQYFANVPQVSWEFYIGGYQPAQKWLKDRKGRQLTFDDIQHYQKIIVALAETGRIMSEVDQIIFV